VSKFKVKCCDEEESRIAQDTTIEGSFLKGEYSLHTWIAALDCSEMLKKNDTYIVISESKSQKLKQNKRQPMGNHLR